MTEAAEPIGATPSPASKRLHDGGEPEASESTPAPVAKRPRTGARDKVATALSAEAAELQQAADASLALAAEAEQEAVDAMEHAKAMAKRAADLNAVAAKAKESAEQAKKKAERADLERTVEGRALAKQQDKTFKKEAREAAKNEKQNEKNQAAKVRAALKEIGDSIKGSMRIAKVGGMWSVPPGNVSFKGVSFEVFRSIFCRGRCAYSPENFGPLDSAISLTTKDAAAIFGSTKVVGGSMYATFTITTMRATYLPGKQQLTISYDTNGW